MNNLIRHSIMCNPKFKTVLKLRQYEGLVWLMQSMAFCGILESTKKHSPEFHREFQLDMLKAAFSIVNIVYYIEMLFLL
jgi:hypothetical protein